jgi:hypothetical protein
VEHGDDCALNPGGAVVSSFKIGLYGCPDLSVCTRSRVVVDRDPRPPLREGYVHTCWVGELKMEGASQREWWERVVLPSLVGGCVLTRGGGAEWGQ